MIEDIFFVSCSVEVDSIYESDQWDNDSYDVEYYRNDPLNENIDRHFALENYHNFLTLISLLEEDIKKRTDGFISCTKEKIDEYRQALVQSKRDEDFGFKYWKELHQNRFHFPYFSYQALNKELIFRIKEEEERTQYYEELLLKNLLTLNQYRIRIDDIYTSIFIWCAENHQLPLSFYHLGFQEFHLGNYIDALDNIKKFIELEGSFNSKVKLLQGELESEICLYQDAIQSLTEAINLNPANQESYFERAACYFELGDFDKSLSDYFASDLKSTRISLDSTEMIAFSSGLVKGLVKGGIEGGLEFIPSILSSLNGLNQGLWAFAQDPVHISKEFVKASQTCIEFVKAHTPKEALIELVPELKELLVNWKQYKEAKKGEAIGHIIGKYGIDIFASMGIAKGVKAYKELKRANNLLTYEAMALSKRNKQFIKLEAAKRAQARKQILKHQKLKIELDKQGKHIRDHKKFLKPKSEFTYSDPQTLLVEHAGTGQKINNKTPGSPGYKERVDFGQIIGIYRNESGTITKETTIGIINYSKKGAHIVPARPKDF